MAISSFLTADRRRLLETTDDYVTVSLHTAAEPGDLVVMATSSGTVLYEVPVYSVGWTGPDALVNRIDTLLETMDAARCDVDQEFDATGLPV